MYENPKKILIVGDSCRGKSTLAKMLGHKLSIPVYNTDDFYWEKKYTVLRDKKETMDMVLPIYEKEAWIMEGTTKKFLMPGVEKSDIVIHLYFTNIFQQIWFIIKRYFKRKNEGLISMLKLIRHVVYTRYKLGYRKNTEHWPEIVAGIDKKVIHLSSWKQVRDFLDNI